MGRKCFDLSILFFGCVNPGDTSALGELVIGTQMTGAVTR